MINMQHNHRKWKEEIEIETASYEPTTCNGKGPPVHLEFIISMMIPGGNVNGVIEEESASTSDSPDPQRDSPSLDSELSQVC